MRLNDEQFLALMNEIGSVRQEVRGATFKQAMGDACYSSTTTMSAPMPVAEVEIPGGPSLPVTKAVEMLFTALGVKWVEAKLKVTR